MKHDPFYNYVYGYYGVNATYADQKKLISLGQRVRAYVWNEADAQELGYKTKGSTVNTALRQEYQPSFLYLTSFAQAWTSASSKLAESCKRTRL